MNTLLRQFVVKTQIDCTDIKHVMNVKIYNMKLAWYSDFPFSGETHLYFYMQFLTILNINTKEVYFHNFLLYYSQINIKFFFSFNRKGSDFFEIFHLQVLLVTSTYFVLKYYKLYHYY